MTRQALCALALTGALAIGLSAQQVGQITGLVRDPSGAVIAGAVVKAKETATGFERRTVTDAGGRYVLPALRPADYIISVEAPGFKTFTQTDVQLQADQSLTLNVDLELGDVTETVEVTAAVPLVDTSTSTIREVVDRDRVVDLPLDGRNVATLTTLVAGTVVAPSAGVNQGLSKTAPGGVVISSNGSRQGGVSYRLDGGNNQDFYTNINQPFPFPDAVQEFSIQTSNYSAAFGNNAGAVVNVVTRSGTNEYHGTLFGFVRNRSLNAKNFFARRKSFLKRSQFGVSGGGPVVLPGYDGHDKTFFFLGWQGTRLRDQRSSDNAFVPTDSQLKGDFTQCGAPCSTPIRDPDGGFFPNNQIPVQRFDPASVKLTENYLPRGTGDGLVFFSGGAIKRDTDEGVAKVDHQLTASDRISGRYFIQHFRNAGIFDNNNLLTYRDSSRIRSQNAVISETHIFSPTLLNEFHFTYNRVHASRRPPSGVPNVNDFGLNIFQPEPKAIQNIGVSGFFSFGDNPMAKFVRNGFEWTDQVSWIRGRHHFTFGGSAARERVDIVNQFRQPGTFNFSGDVTGLATADFLLGRLRQFRQGSGEFKNNRNTFIAFFAQDDIKVNSRLTINLGLRYEPFFPWREERNRVEQFRPVDFQDGFRSTVFRNAPPGLRFPGDPGFIENGAKGDHNNLAPRVGFAWDVFGDGRTSVRGGAGLFYDQREQGIINNQVVDVTPFSTQLLLIEPEGPFSNPFRNRENPFPAPPPNADSPFPLPVVAVGYAGRATTPVSYNWNLTVEREVAPNWLARVAYVGSHGSHQRRLLELNPAVFVPGVDAEGRPISTTANTDSRRIFAPYFSSIRQHTPDGNSSYHSLQLGLNKRFSQGFTILANYTISKSLDIQPPGASGAGDNGRPPTLPYNVPNNRKFDSGPSDFDHTHRFVTSYVWDLPDFIRGDNAALKKLLNGWQYTGTFTFQTGSPLTILSGRDNSLTGIGLDRAILTGRDPARPDGADRTQSFFNQAAFAVNPTGTFGNVGKGRFRGPNLAVWNMGVFKNTAIGERIHTQFRAEFFNAFNRVNFNNPGTTVRSGNFGKILSAREPRIIQLGLKIMF